MDDDVSPSGNEAEQSSSSSSSSSSWRPRQLVFVPYALQKARTSPAPVRKSIVSKLTKEIVETYRLCNPLFKYSDELNLKRFLTSPSVGMLNDGYDNSNSDLILSVNFVMVNSDSQRRYIVRDMLGQGSFGQVAKCWDTETSSFVAVKVIKNQPAYYQQALVEVSILEAFNRKYDPEDKHHIVRIYDYFRFQRHLCIAFELLDTNLYELLKINQFRGVTLNIVQLFSKQILRGLALMKEVAIIHCDLKPENILLCPGLKPPEIKIIDFGSACPEDRTVYSYIQSRYYRSPEVLLGYKYSTAIDMWSFGCIVAELFLGLPLFPGASSFDLLMRMIRILGGQPPDYLLKEAKNTSKFFKCIASVQPKDNGEFSTGGRSVYQTLTEEEYEARELKKPPMGKEYFSYMSLEAIVTSYPYKKNLSGEDVTKEKEIRLALIDFLKGLVEFDPAKRWSPFQASKHPFVTGEPFTGPYKPRLETPHVPVSQNVQVDHHPGGGHWFAAGLSPHIMGMNRGSLHNSPHFQAVPYSYATSYGSLGSHGSYNDNIGIGSSYGSYGDNSNNFAYYSPVGPSAFNLHPHGGGMTFLGSSPDARRIISHFPHGGGGLGASPSTGNYAPLPLDTSPAQFPSQGSYPAGSPGHYGPTSPVRGSVHGSPLGKMATAGNLNRRKSWGYSGNLQSQDSSSSQHWQGNFTDGPSSNQSNSYGSNWKQQRGDGGISGSYHNTHNVPGSFMHDPGDAHEKPEHSLSQPDPANWFSNYSDDLLLQEDGSDANGLGLATEFSKGMHLDQPSVSAEQLAGAGRFNWATNPNPNLSNKRTNGPLQASLHVGMGGPPSAHDPHNGYPRFMPNSAHFTSQLPTTLPSRFGQHSVPRLNHGGSTSNNGGEWNNIRTPPSSTFNTGSQGQHSFGNNQLNNGSSRGRRGNNPITHNLPTSHGRGRIS